MTRARSLSYLLWSFVAIGCGDDGTKQVGGLADAPPAPDAPGPDATPDAPDVPVGPAFALGEVPLLQATCGAEPADIELTVRNTGDEPLVLSEPAITEGFALNTTLPLTIAPGASAALLVRLPPAVIGTDRGGATKPGSLTVKTNEATSPTRNIDVTTTVMGANLDFVNDSDEPVSLSFSSGNGCAPLAMFLRNSGNQPVELSAATTLSGSPPSLGFDGFSGGTLEAGTRARQDVHVVTSGACSGFDTASYGVTSGNVCTTGTTIQATITLGFGTNCFCS